MIRAISMFGFGGIFLAISPQLRNDAYGALGKGAFFMSFYSPFSYIALAIAALISMMVAFKTGARAR